MPSSSSVAQTCAGETSTNRSLVQHLEHPLALGLGERPLGRRARPRRPWRSGGRRRRYTVAGDAPSARHAGLVPIIGVSSSTVSQIIARCSRARPRYRASAPRALRRFPGSRSPGAPSSARPRRARPAAQLGDLRVAPVGRLAPARLAELLQRAVLALLAPVRQMRRVQPLTAQQLADLARRSCTRRPSRGSRSLYFAVNLRRLARSTSSGSGTPAGAARPPATNPSSPTARWTSRPAAAASAAPAPFALVSNISGGLRSRPQGH